MRHRVAGRKLNRTSEHRLALRRNLVASLFEHETISTTIEKAKEVKPFAEKLITLAKKGCLQHRRRAIQLLGNRKIVVREDGEDVKQGTVVGKLFSEIGPRYLDRSGGYTRIIRLPLRRLGDNGELVLLQLVGKDDSRNKKNKPRRKTQDVQAETTKPIAEEVAADAEEAVEAVAVEEQAAAPEETDTPDTVQDEEEKKEQ
ncbi:50S ribosomal protein L17 [Planctomycetota bacterium]